MSRIRFQRVLAVIPTFFGITLVIFLLMRAAPGSVADLLGEGSATASARAQLLGRLGLDRPIWMQYLGWLAGLLTGDLGVSFRTGQPVAELLAARVPASLLLTGGGVLLAVLAALPLGIAAAAQPRSGWDRLAGVLSLLSFGVPGFLLSLGLVYLFAVTLRVLPGVGMSAAGLVLPVCAVAFSALGGILRQTRSACLELRQENFVRTARAKGLREWRVMVFHVARVGLAPIVTAILAHFPHIIGGSLVIERVFGWPGMGSLLFAAVAGRDYPVILGQTVTVTVAVLAANLTLDLLYGVMDPRVTDEGGHRP